MSPRSYCCSFCFVAYLCNLLPYLAVTRQAFIYHYMPGLHYASLLTALVIDMLVPVRWQRSVVLALLLPVVVTFVYLLPWIFGFPTSFEAHSRRRWIKTWD